MALPRRLPKKEKRDGRWKSPAHLKFVRGFHCAMPGCQGMPIEAAHVRLGSGAGMGFKPSDDRAVPLCASHHRAQHTQGEATFWKAYEIAAGQTVDQLIDELCRASPKRSEILTKQRARALAYRMGSDGTE